MYNRVGVGQIWCWLALTGSYSQQASRTCYLSSWSCNGWRISVLSV